ncbi:hypothetical protein DVH05_009026 [Phytophthora capsici]|nr:hypothetical protein DVH05_009026 [Phytophthora capsici]
MNTPNAVPRACFFPEGRQYVCNGIQQFGTGDTRAVVEVGEMPLGTKCAHHGRTTVEQLPDDSGSPRQSGAGFGRTDGELTFGFRGSAEGGFYSDQTQERVHGGKRRTKRTDGDGTERTDWRSGTSVRVLGLRTVDGTDGDE